MPNILITNFCNRNCPYCFAKAQVKLGTTVSDWEMSEEEYDTVLSYLDPARDIVSILGGEPTLHSSFGKYIDKVYKMGFKIKIFTNGATKNLREIAHLKDSENLLIILNLNEPDTYNSSEWKEIETNFETFGDKIALSFNVYQPEFNWQFLKDAIIRFGLYTNIRLGVAQPIQVINNEYLREKDLKRTMTRIVDMAQDMAPFGISLGFDCGFRMCDFTDEQLGTLIQCGTVPMFKCGPNLDIGPNLDVWRCFPFSLEKGEKLTDYNSLSDLIDYFNNDWMKTKKIDNSKCNACNNYSIDSCAGGCLSRKIVE
ncbi:MAG: radical SAM protein [Spirochaetes bacterium]|nr:radical SAM protein [Spirochaetota bacterium]MBN2770144.1 radical SAM protein [Spirochaetota bacterium]